MKIVGIYRTHQHGKTPEGFCGADEPLGLEYILAVAHQENHEVSLCVPETEADVKEIAEGKPDLILYSSCTNQFPYFRDINNQLAKNTSAISIIGGYHASALPESVLSEGFDIVVRGEGEETFRELMQRISTESNLDDVKGISFKKNGLFIHNPQRKRIANLDEYPPPFRTRNVLSGLSNYLGYPESSRRKTAYMEWERGCPNSCSYCASPSVIGRNLVYRSPESVTQEMKRLKDRWGINHFFFTDLNMSLNTATFEQLANHLIEANLGVYWSFMSGFKGIYKPGLIKKVAQAGCIKINWGIENLRRTPDICSKTLKLPDVKKMQEILNLTAEAGIMNEGFYMLGWPNETEKELREIPKMISALNLHLIRPTIYTPLPGSAEYELLKERIMEKDLTKFDTNHLVYEHPRGLTAQVLGRIRDDVLKEFYFGAEYKKRVREFVNAHPRFSKTFEEFQETVRRNLK